MTIKGFIVALIVGFIIYEAISIPLGYIKKKRVIKELEIQENKESEEK